MKDYDILTSYSTDLLTAQENLIYKVEDVKERGYKPLGGIIEVYDGNYFYVSQAIFRHNYSLKKLITSLLLSLEYKNLKERL